MLPKVIYTTNAIESLNYQLQKVTKNRGRFPSTDAAVKLLWLAICNIKDKRTANPRTSAKPKAGSTRARSSRTGNKPSPNSPRPTPTESPPTYDPAYTNNLTGSRSMRLPY